jgi:hypothetical protein
MVPALSNVVGASCAMALLANTMPSIIDINTFLIMFFLYNLQASQSS